MEEEDSFRQQIGLEISKMLDLENSYIRCRNLDTSESR